MKKSSIGDSAAYIAVNIAIFIVRVLPIRFGLYLGKGIGMLMYWGYPKRKKIAYANLKAAFGREKQPDEIKKILKKTYKNYGQTLIEFLRTPAMSADYVRRHVIMEKLEMVEEAKKRLKGGIYLTAHFGNWELSCHATAVRGFPIYMLARPQKMVKMNEMINRFRQKFGSKVVNKGMASREIIKSLKNNEMVGILSDQDAGKKARFVDFFGRKASCATGAFSLARKTGSVIIPTFMIRNNGPHHTIKFEPFIEVSPEKDAETEIGEKLQEFVKIQESYIRKFPDQWLWVHKRWKSTPCRRILVLSDKKQGHLNQSKAVLKAYLECRRNAGYVDSDTSVKFVDVEFKSRNRRHILALASRFADSSCQGCMRCLKFCLTERSYKELIMDYADVIISCGSSVAAVNMFLSYENNAKNATIMKPGITGIGRFNIAFIPEHDRPPKRKNIVLTNGSPNAIDAEALAGDADKLKASIGALKPNTIGFLIGGDNAEFKFSNELARKLASQVESLVDGLDAEFLLTTSRRTPEEIDRYLDGKFKKNPRCKLLVFPNKSNPDGVVNGILGLSKLVVVSADSISMVSEAASSGKKVLVFDLEKKSPLITKHERMLERLANSAVIVRAPVDKISETALRVLKENEPVRKLDDAEKIYKALYRII